MTALRERMGIWAALAAILLILSPTPAPRALAQSIRSAQTAWRNARPAASLAEIKAALAREPGLGAALHLAAAQAALDAGDPIRALDHARQALTGGADLTAANCLVAEARIAAGFDAELAMDPAFCRFHPATLRRLVDNAFIRERWQIALSALQALAAGTPTDPVPRMELGLLLAIQHPGAASAHLEASLALAGEPLAPASEVLRLIEDFGADEPSAGLQADIGLRLAAAGRWRLAKLAFGSAVEQRPDLALGRAYLGLARDQLGEDGGADLAQAVRLAPGSAAIRAMLGRHWLARGDVSAAQAELETAALLDPSDPAVAAQLGDVYAAQGELEAAEAAFRAAVERAPQDSAFWLLLAQHSLTREIKVETLGIPAARAAVLLDPPSGAASEALGIGHMLMGDLGVAERLLRKAVELAPTRASAHYRLGVVFRMLGQASLAQREWQAAITLNPDGPIGNLARRALEGP